MKAKGKSNSKNNALDTDVTLKKLGDRIKQLRIKKAMPAMNILPTIIIFHGCGFE